MASLPEECGSAASREYLSGPVGQGGQGVSELEVQEEKGVRNRPGAKQGGRGASGPVAQKTRGKELGPVRRAEIGWAKFGARWFRYGRKNHRTAVVCIRYQVILQSSARLQSVWPASYVMFDRMVPENNTGSCSSKQRKERRKITAGGEI